MSLKICNKKNYNLLIFLPSFNKNNNIKGITMKIKIKIKIKIIK